MRYNCSRKKLVRISDLIVTKSKQNIITVMEIPDQKIVERRPSEEALTCI